MDEAIKKINAEMQKDPQNTYLEIVGHYIIDRCHNEEESKKVLDEKKTLSGAMKEMYEAARKKAKAQCAVMKDSEIFDCIDKYFGFSKSEDARSSSIASIDGAYSAPAKQSTDKLLDIDFESLI